MTREATITLYNCTPGEGGTTYNRSVLRVHLESEEGARDNKTKQDPTDSYVLFIPFSIEREIGKTYVEPKTFETMKNKRGAFTFKKGDLIAIGTAGEITNLKQFLMTHETFRIQKCSTYGFGMPNMRHWEVHCN